MPIQYPAVFVMLFNIFANPGNFHNLFAGKFLLAPDFGKFFIYISFCRFYNGKSLLGNINIQNRKIVFVDYMCPA